MTLYGIANYLHVLGAMGVVAALCLEWAIVLRLRTAESVEQARQWLGLARIQRTLGPASLAALLLGGLYMVATQWGGAGFIIVGFFALLVIAALGAYNGVRLDRMRRSFADQTGQLPAELQARLRQPSFMISVQVRAAILLGVVFLMVGKLDLDASLLTFGLAMVLGLASTIPVWRRAPARGAETFTR